MGTHPESAQEWHLVRSTANASLMRGAAAVVSSFYKLCCVVKGEPWPLCLVRQMAPKYFSQPRAVDGRDPAKFLCPAFGSGPRGGGGPDRELRPARDSTRLVQEVLIHELPPRQTQRLSYTDLRWTQRRTTLWSMVFVGTAAASESLSVFQAIPMC